MKYIINASGIVFFLKGKPIKVEKSSPDYPKIINAFQLPEDKLEEALTKILEDKISLENGKFEKDGFVFNDGEVHYNGDLLPDILAKKIFAIHKEGLPITLFKNFWENLKQNPSYSSVRELYNFLSYKELPITEDGCFIAYKGLRDDWYSVTGNTSTKVLKGTVDSKGRILNKVGEEIEVQRNHVDDNRANHCSSGLHAGSLEYAKDFSKGKLVVVKINPKDVVSVPEDYQCQKVRICAYKVIDEFKMEIAAPILDEQGEEVVGEDKKKYLEFVNKISTYLSKKIAKGVSSVSVQQIQNSFSPEYPSKEKVLNALNDLDFIWHESENGSILVFLV